MKEVELGLYRLFRLFLYDIVHRNVIYFRKLDENAKVGNGLPALPLGYGFIRVIKFFGKLRLSLLTVECEIFAVEL